MYWHSYIIVTCIIDEMFVIKTGCGLVTMETSVYASKASIKKELSKERNRTRVAIKRAGMSKEEKERDREVQRVRALNRRHTETTDEKSKRRERERARSTLRRKTEDTFTREVRLKAGRERAAKKRESETELEREQRLKVTRERLAIRRKLRKAGRKIHNMRKRECDDNEEILIEDVYMSPKR